MEHIKKNISIVLVCIVGMICTYITIDLTIDKKKYDSATVPDFNIPNEIAKFSPGTITQFPAVKVEAFLGEEKKNTLVSKPKPKLTLRRLTLNAIMIQGKEKLVNINGKMMKVGEHINGRTILKIQKNSVLLTGPKGRQTLRIKN